MTREDTLPWLVGHGPLEAIRAVETFMGHIVSRARFRGEQDPESSAAPELSNDDLQAVLTKLAPPEEGPNAAGRRLFATHVWNSWPDWRIQEDLYDLVEAADAPPQEELEEMILGFYEALLDFEIALRRSADPHGRHGGVGQAQARATESK